MFFRKPKMPEQSAGEFLKAREIKENSLEAMFALKLREILADYASKKKVEQVLAAYRVESELNIAHVDSLDLTDVVSRWRATAYPLRATNMKKYP